MKIFLLLSIIILYSCEKSYCWKCTTIVENKSSIDTLTTIECGISEKEIDYYELLMSVTMTVIKDTITTVTKITTGCIKN